uniref:GNAT family N-acetyltransferase n=1 Tax=candidate division CPR3 bacterium TaxID=2268181 RepID=A0A7V3JAC2_UNCC3
MKKNIYSEEEQIYKIGESWMRLAHHPNSDLEHFLLVCKLRKQVLSPWVFSVNDGGECKAIIAGRIEENILRPRIGYLKLPGIKVRSLAIIHNGILGELDKEGGAEAFLLELLEMFRRDEVQVVVFSHLKEGHIALWNILSKMNNSMGIRRPNWVNHRALRIKSDPEFLLKRLSSKHRSWLKNREKKLKEMFQEKLRWIWHSNFHDIREICIKMEAVANKTYQRGLGAGFIDNEETRKRLSFFAQKGMLRVMLLEGDEVPISFWYGIVYKNVFHAAATGYLPDVAKYEVGTLTLMKTIEELSKEEVLKLDYGLGDASYKERFSDISWREASFQIFAPTMKGKILRNYIALAETIDLQLRKFAAKTGSLDYIKRTWRNLLRQSRD